MFPYFHCVLQRTVELLIGEREEQFELERAIRLMEFRTWIYSPDTNMPNIAGLMAAVLLLENVEDDIFFEESELAQRRSDPDAWPLIDLSDKPNATLGRVAALRSNETYRALHDFIFASRGSLETLLYCPSPPQFDANLESRRDKAKMAANLIDYRLRHAQHGSAYPGHRTTRHAVFFNWWPTYDIPGRKGATIQSKSPSTKTLFRWAREFENTALFVYLNETCGFSEIPKFEDDVGDFSRPLRADATDVDRLRRFFGAYAYIAEAIEAKDGKKPVVTLPSTLPRVEIQTVPFSQTELQTIVDYSKNAVLMDK